MRVLLLAALAVALPAPTVAEAPAAPELPAPYATPVAVKQPRVLGWPPGTVPQALPNFRVTIFARGLDNPRSLLVLPNGDVLVAESRGGAGEIRPSANRITLLRDTTGGGAADLQFVLLDGLDRPYGLALRRDRLYVGDTDAVLSCPFLVGQTRMHGECRTLIELPSAGGRDHWTRNLAFNPDETRLYVSVGSSSNVDEGHVDANNPLRAAILVAQPDGRDLRVYASGLRNPVGLAFEPVSGRLYTTVEERDLLGDELVPDFLTHVQDGAFYGWPYAYFGAHEDPRRKGERPDLVARAVVPDLALEAHGTPLGLVFYGREQFPRSYRGGAFIALHGSWNRSTFTGYKVVQVPFSRGRPAGPPQDFLTGFIADAGRSEVYGRPAGLAVATDGALLVADDAGNTIWRVTFKCAACTPDPAPPRPNDSRRERSAVPARN
ncbi:MAG TPA: sorbosone dehydrogenase family protein [Steroidobacteraceae bacterium]|nr:sorbosone dehydrogenase family protein [Steroidobacteraceae bacterium]